MKEEPPNVISSVSRIPYSYTAIRVTKSRIDKGLIAIPVALADRFPERNTTIQVYLDDSPQPMFKKYSSYNSSTRECRIGGIGDWFLRNNVRSEDEIVIQFIDEEHFVYRLIPERKFVFQTTELQKNFDKVKSEEEASENIVALVQWTHLQKEKVALSEYRRLIDSMPILNRRYIPRLSNRARESVPANLRLLLEYIYHGHCQVCDFRFLKADGRPYFEVHHLCPENGHHPKNLVVVCGNCHNQFENANVKRDLDDSLLIRVSFNETVYSVRQALLEIKPEPYFKHLFT